MRDILFSFPRRLRSGRVHVGCLASITLAVVLVAAAAQRCAAAATWNALTTPRFVVISQLGEKSTRAWAMDFTQFIESMRAVLTVNERTLPPLTVVLFDRERDFEPFKPLRPDGKRAASVDGFFYSRATWSVTGMATAETNEQTRQLIQHEGVHWFTSADTRDYPLWFKEGLAEVFSTFNVRGHDVRWGDLLAWHVQELRSEPMLPLSRLLHLSRTDKLFNESDRTGLFYAESWLLVHYMLFGKREGERSQLSTYLDAWRKGENPDVAFQTAFGKDYAGMDKDLERYVNTGTFFVRKTAAANVDTSGWTFARATPPMVEVALARLAIGSSRHDLAAKHIEQAVALAPDQPDGYELRALLEYDLTEDPDAANPSVLAAAEQAIKLGSKDAHAYELAATEKWRTNRDLGGVLGRDAREIANLYERAINLRPNLRYAFVNLAGIVSLADPLRDEDVKFLKAGRFFFPDDGKIVFGLAKCAEKMGHLDEAQKLVAMIRERDDILAPPELMQSVNETETFWMRRECFERIDAAVKARQFKEALKIFDELIAKTDDVGPRANFVLQREQLAQMCALSEVDDAIRAGSYETARAKINDLLRSGGLPQSAQARLRQQLEWIENSTASAHQN